MTREEIIDGLELYTISRLKKERVHITVEELQNFIDEIKALQEPKTDKDCISREKTLEKFCDYVGSGMSMNDFDALYDIVAKMPSVQPKAEQEPKTVLYSGDGYADGYMVYDMAECPNCGYEYEDGDKDWGENFCPHCGQPLKWESEGI